MDETRPGEIPRFVPSTPFSANLGDIVPKEFFTQFPDLTELQICPMAKSQGETQAILTRLTQNSCGTHVILGHV